MTLHLYNTASRQKEAFEPLDPAHVRMYVCGPTVYDRAHIGNARPVVVFDVLFKLLERHYPKVTYVRNITDIDDKIIAAAAENGEEIEALTRRTTAFFHADMAALGAAEPTEEPRATAHVPEMLALIERLMETGHAYAAEGHVLFHVPAMEGYGELSNRKREELVAGSRVEVAPYKKDPGDFILWKPSTPEQPGWDSPWGRGRPGWHLECSAMSERYLGETFDIHGGGRDLIFPHHENERAQSMCAHGGKTFARYWVHNGYVVVEGEKMSKSLGNFFTVEDLLARAPGEALRFNMLKTHYRHPLDWTLEGMAESKAELGRLYEILGQAEGLEIDSDIGVPDAVEAALLDDLNTPLAIAELHAVANEFSRTQSIAAKSAFLAAGRALGILQMSFIDWVECLNLNRQSVEGDMISDAEIRELSELRISARNEEDYLLSDQIRDKLISRGVILEDTNDGTNYRRVPNPTLLENSELEKILGEFLDLAAQSVVDKSDEYNSVFQRGLDPSFRTSIRFRNGVLFQIDSDMLSKESAIAVVVLNHFGARQVSESDIIAALWLSVDEYLSLSKEGNAIWRAFSAFCYHVEYLIDSDRDYLMPSSILNFEDGMEVFEFGHMKFMTRTRFLEFIKTNNKGKTIENWLEQASHNIWISVPVHSSPGAMEIQAREKIDLALGLLRLAAIEYGDMNLVPRIGYPDPQITETSGESNYRISIAKDGAFRFSSGRARQIYTINKEFSDWIADKNIAMLLNDLEEFEQGKKHSSLRNAVVYLMRARRQSDTSMRLIMLWVAIEALNLRFREGAVSRHEVVDVPAIGYAAAKVMNLNKKGQKKVEREIGNLRDIRNRIAHGMSIWVSEDQVKSFENLVTRVIFGAYLDVRDFYYSD